MNSAGQGTPGSEYGYQTTANYTSQTSTARARSGLVPCPFCKEDDKVWPHRFGGEGEWQMECQSCGATGPMAKERHLAVQAWNRRATL